MDDETRRQHLEILRNPKSRSSSMAWDYGVLARDLPPRRTLRERLRVLVPGRRRRERGGGSGASE